MKPFTLLCISCLLACAAYSQEFKFYLNGSNVEDSTYADQLQKGDLMRVVFSGKTTPYKFRIASVLVTLVPRAGSANAEIIKPTGFILDNTTKEYSNYPSFTFDILDRLELLKHNDCDLTIQVNQLFSDSQEGTDWVASNVTFKAVTIKPRNKTTASK